MKCYPGYKESDSEFISALPDHWQMKKLKHVTEFINNGTTAPQIPTGQTNYAVTRIETISTGEVNFQKIGHVNYWGGIENFRLILGDILFSHINSLEVLGNCAMFQNTARLYHGMNLLRIRPNDSIAHRFLLYWLRSYSTNQLIKSFAKVAIGQVSVSITNLKEIPVAYPPLPEQHAIANFLDHKTQQIDDLIRVKERKIELLQEYRASLINQAVTKGLDPNVEMKPSGIGWMGAIPRHWTTKRLKYLGKSIIGLSYKPDNLTDDKQGTLVLRASNIQDGKPSFVDNVYVNVKVDEKIVVKEGDILICSRSGSRNLIGKNMTITKELEGVTFGVFMTVFRTRFFRFISHFLSSQVFKSYSGLFHTSTINQLTINTLNNFKICLPPYDEQAKIADLLDGKTKQLDELRSNEEQTIKLLKEYRQSLISAVVTGKMDVRDEV